MNQIIFGDCIEVMNKLISDGIKVQTCITSPPYFGLRDYGVEGQIGLEETPQAYVDKMVKVFRCVRDLTTRNPLACSLSPTSRWLVSKARHHLG